MKSLLLPLKYILNHQLTKGQPVQGIFRFVQWQIRSRINSGEHIYTWISDLKLSVKKGMHGATGCIYVGLPEFEDMGFLLHFLNTEDLFIDIGANVGSYTILASGNNNSTSISIEPVPSTFSWLKKNIELNHLNEKVSSFNIGLGDVESVLHFTNGLGTTNHVVDKSFKDAIEVPVKKLDDLVDIDDLETDILIKLDVEGFEYNVLIGGQTTLCSDKTKAIIVELNGSGNRYGFKDSLVDEKLRSFGFSTYSYDPFTKSLKLIPIFNTEGNTLYIKRVFLEEVQDKLLNASSFEVNNTRI